MDISKNIEESGRRLGRDMKAIREDREVTLEAISRETKAAGNVLEEFEHTALVGNPMYNRVYLRLFMRSYAEVVGVRTDDALRAADEMLAGQYTDRLRRLYLDQEPAEGGAGAETAVSGVPAAAAPAEPPPTEQSKPSTQGAASSRTSDGTSGADASKPSAPSADSAKTADGQPAAEAAKARSKGGTKAPTGAPEPSRPEPPATTKAAQASGGSGTVAAGRKGRQSKLSVPAASAAPSAAGSESSPGGVLILNGPSLLRWAGGVAGVVIIALAAWFFWPDPIEPPPPPVQVAPPDTTQRAPALPPRIVLGDTTSFFVIAARDTLNPIRITVDGGIRAPYWIEYLDSLELRVSQELVLEQRLNAVDVSVNDILLPTDGRDAANRLVLSKDMAQAFLDSLRAAGGSPGAGLPND